MMLTQQAIARLGALAGMIHGLISSWLYWRNKSDEESWMGYIVAPLAVALWSLLGSGVARSFIQPTLGALLGAILGAILPSLLVFLVLSRLQRPLREKTRAERILRTTDLGLLDCVTGATLGTAPREAMAGGLAGIVVGILAAIALTIGGLDKRWRVPSAVKYTGWPRWLMNVIFLAMAGALLGAELEILFDADRALTSLLFP
jgi:hypothetical protein